MNITVSMARSKIRESPEKRAVRRLGFVLFMIYLVCLIYFLFFADWYNHTPGSYSGMRYNLVPFREIRRFLVYRNHFSRTSLFLNLGGNVIGFFPFGFFLPVISRSFRKGWLVTMLGFLMSASVELVQLVTRTGCCDVDDVILNTLGAAIGYLIFLICDAFRRWVYVR